MPASKPPRPPLRAPSFPCPLCGPSSFPSPPNLSVILATQNPSGLCCPIHMKVPHWHTCMCRDANYDKRAAPWAPRARPWGKWTGASPQLADVVLLCDLKGSIILNTSPEEDGRFIWQFQPKRQLPMRCTVQCLHAPGEFGLWIPTFVHALPP